MARIFHCNELVSTCFPRTRNNQKCRKMLDKVIYLEIFCKKWEIELSETWCFIELDIFQIDQRFLHTKLSQLACDSPVALTESSSQCACFMSRRSSRGCDTQHRKRADHSTRCRCPSLLPIRLTVEALIPNFLAAFSTIRISSFSRTRITARSSVSVTVLGHHYTTCSAFKVCIGNVDDTSFHPAIWCCVSLPQQPHELLLAILHCIAKIPPSKR